MAPAISIVIPTKGRETELALLLSSISHLDGRSMPCPEIIVSDNNSDEAISARILTLTRSLPLSIRVIRVRRPGKSAAINDALEGAKGNFFAFLDDDVVVDGQWLKAVYQFCSSSSYPVGQGRILPQLPDAEDSELRSLLQRYRTIPSLSFDNTVDELHSLNGANFVIRREILEQLGGFDERLGPGASGTSEDVELARRVQQSGHKIGYMRNATVYHNVDRTRLTEAYFKQIHRHQGASRWLIKKPGRAQIWYDLGRASLGYCFYKSIGQERKIYRNKGRIYHYLGMLEEKRRQKLAR